MNKADKERAQRMIERLDQAEIQIQMRSRRASSWPNKNKRQINQGIRERAETQLRLSQIDVARNFFERRLYQQSPSTGPVPMEILKIVKDVSSPNTMSRPREVV
jgi:2'-5' RNA ligase